MSHEKKWWHEAVGYQIYPKSFQDTNGDGIGDLPGITQHLDQLVDLGINVIWVSPINLSPMADHGYDIADYYQIDPSFGTNEDFDNLIVEAKKRNIRILMDLVINHTSEEHPWFQAALKDLDSEFADYYIIKETTDGLPPNNWRSIFNGSVWEPIAGTNKYYFHMFTKEQPDLNWENPELREKLYEIIEYWLAKGVAGFRIDAITHIKKIFADNDLPADGPDGLVTKWELYRDATGIGEFLAEMRDHAFSKEDILTIAEMEVEDPERWDEYFGNQGYFSSMFDFYHSPYTIQAPEYEGKPAKFVDMLKKKLFAKQVQANGRVFFANFLENHDTPRMPERLIPKADIGFNSITAWTTSYLFLRGIPVIYQGQEIGMTNFPKDTIDGYIDGPTHNKYQDYLLRGYSPVGALTQINIENRENARTPMQWTNDVNAGFTTGTPWFEVNPNYIEINYQKQEQDAHSILSFFKKAIQLRKNTQLKDLMIYGRTIPILQNVSGVLAYYRELDGKRIVQLANLNDSPAVISVKHVITDILLINYGSLNQTTDSVTLAPYQALLYFEEGRESIDD